MGGSAYVVGYRSSLYLPEYPKAPATAWICQLLFKSFLYKNVYNINTDYKIVYNISVILIWNAFIEALEQMSFF